MEQKQLHLEIAQEMLDCLESDSKFLNTVITCYETWVYGYDPETKAQSSQWKYSSSPRPKKARQVRRNVKGLLTVFSTPVGWCITNTHHKANPSPNSTTRGYFVAFVMLCGANDRAREQQKLCSSITTMHPPILRI